MVDLNNIADKMIEIENDKTLTEEQKMNMDNILLNSISPFEWGRLAELVEEKMKNFSQKIDIWKNF